MKPEEIYNKFLDTGFSKTESKWAQDHLLDPDDPLRGEQIEKLLQNRRDKIAMVMKVYGWTKGQARQRLEWRRRTYAKFLWKFNKSIDIDDIFWGES